MSWFNNCNNNNNAIKDKIRDLEYDLRDAEYSLKNAENDYWDCKFSSNNNAYCDMPNLYTNLIYYKDKVGDIKDKIRDLERQL